MVSPLVGARLRAAGALACIGLLAACGQPTREPLPTSTAAVSTETTTPPATQIAEPTSIAIDFAEIRILAPGPDSLATSPIELRAELAPGANGIVRIELMDGRGRLLAGRVLELNSNLLETQLAFELGRPSQTARLTISTQDEYGRTQALNSVDLTLLASGAPSIFAPAPSDPIVIEEPQDGAELAGDSLRVRGRAQTPAGRPLTVQLVTREGRVLAFREVYAQEGAFVVEFNLDLDEPTWVQVAVIESGGLAPGVAHFKGVEILVSEK